MNNINYIENLECDVLIVGSGGTGSQATQAAAEVLLQAHLSLATIFHCVPGIVVPL